MEWTDHLDSEEIYALLDGRLDERREQKAEAHLCRCAACREIREECSALLSELRWYGAETPLPPAGYWSEFWPRWSARLHPARRTFRRALVPMGLAASIALAIVISMNGDSSPGTVAQGPSPSPREVLAGTDWAEDYEALERMTVAVGAGPLSKGIVLASMVEGR